MPDILYVKDMHWRYIRFCEHWKVYLNETKKAPQFSAGLFFEFFKKN